MKRILVTGAGGSAAANFVKSLRMVPEPFYIVGTDIKPHHLELSEVDRRYLVPPARSPDYIDKLNSLIERERIDLVHPQPPAEVTVLSECRHQVNACLFMPAQETVRLCQDKMSLIEKLSSAGVPVPESYLIQDEDNLRRSLKTLLSRYEKAWLRAIRGAGSRAALPIKKIGHGLAWIDYWAETHGIGYGDFMLSEFLPGQEFAFQSLWLNGDLVTSQARTRLEYIFGNLTASGQSSSPSLARTVHRDDVNRFATWAVRVADPDATGIFCLDMKENAQGVPCVTEINAGRFFTTTNFFSEAGCNMPYYYIKMAYGESLPDLPKYNPVPEGWYWTRMIDMGHKLVRGEIWTSRPV